MMRHVRWAALLAGLAFGALAQVQTVVLTGAAAVTEVNGTVQVRVGNDPPRPVLAGQRVPAGATLTTGSDSTMVLLFADGQVIVLGERTIFGIFKYDFVPTDLERSEVFLNLIEGSARLVMGSIGQFDPALIRIQAGTGTLFGAVNPEGGNAADAGIVLQEGAIMATVRQGRLVLTLPTGRGIVVASGQGIYVPANGNVQQGSIEQMSTRVGQTAPGKLIVERMDAMQSFAFPQRDQQTVITLAVPGSIETTIAQLPAAAATEILPPLVTSAPTTAATGGSGGGTPCAASCN